MSNSKFQTLCAFLFAFFLQLCAICFLLASIASADTLTWINPTTNADGTPCTDLSGIELSSNGAVTNVGLVTSKTVTPAVTTTYMVRAYDTSGNRSIWSSSVIIAVATATPTASPSASPSPTPIQDQINQWINEVRSRFGL